MVLIIGGSFQGKLDFARDNFTGFKIINSLHLTIREKLDSGLDQDTILSEILKEADDNTVVISDEIGGGVVPIEANERRWRDVTGRILIELAKDADEVYRVVCGIGQRIK